MNGKIKHTNRRMEGPRRAAASARGGAGAGRYLRCWRCCCCIYFAGYQHGLVSMLCVWLHPESRKGGKGGKERKQKKEKKTNEKRRKEMSK